MPGNPQSQAPQTFPGCPCCTLMLPTTPQLIETRNISIRFSQISDKMMAAADAFSAIIPQRNPTTLRQFINVIHFLFFSTSVSLTSPVSNHYPVIIGGLVDAQAAGLSCHPPRATSITPNVTSGFFRFGAHSVPQAGVPERHQHCW